MKTVEKLFEELKGKGGAWLGTARRWIQCRKLNGERVTWGSTEALNPPMTMREVEDLSAYVAATAENEVAKKYEELLEAAKWALNGLEMFASEEAKRRSSTPELCDYTFAKALRNAIRKIGGR